MILSLNSATINGRVKWPEVAELAAKVGFSGVDPDLNAGMRAGVEATKELLSRLNLKPAACGFSVEFRKDDTVFETGMAKLPELARFAAAIGCPRMVTYVAASTDTPKAELRAQFKKRFTAAAKVLAEHGVRLGLEFLGPLHIRQARPHEFIWRMPEMMEFARECGPNMGLLLDAWHWHHAGATPEDIVAAGKAGIVHVHLSDAPAHPPEQIRDSERLMPGEGVINWAGFFGALKKIGYQDAASVEVFGRGLKFMTPEEAARLAATTSQALMAKHGVAWK
jgi:sugar phosphate isomerase/epimerase